MTDMPDTSPTSPPTSPPTIVGLVDMIFESLVERGCDLSPSDLAFAISVFLESVFVLDVPDSADRDAGVQRIIGELHAVRDEQ